MAISSSWSLAFGIGGTATAVAALWVSVISNRRGARKDYAESLEHRLVSAERRLSECETARTRFERLYYQLLAEVHGKG